MKNQPDYKVMSGAKGFKKYVGVAKYERRLGSNKGGYISVGNDYSAGVTAILM